MLVMEVPDQAAQERLGARLADNCPAGSILFLEGNLGVGKTTLARGFLRGLGYQGAVRSPTYTLLEPYDLASKSVCHLDLYRLADPEELEYMGLRDLLDDEAILLVEWPERGAGSLPVADLRIHIDYAPSGRRVTISADSALGETILQQLRNAP